MTEAQAYFISHAAALVREMPIPQAKLFLGGLLELVGPIDEVFALRQAFIHLGESGRQLDLIAPRQPSLPLK